MATILGIESTCDETAASVVVDGWDVRSNVIASQAEIHARYRGVVPEIASRAHIENILPVLKEPVETAGVSFEDLDAIAVAHRPGLIGSLLIGLTAAKTLAWSLGKPLIAVDHVHAHLYSVVLNKDEGGRMKAEKTGTQLVSSSIPHSSSLFPAVGLVISGGHTALYRINAFDDITLIGSTIDDAVGEAYDKVAAILGLGYPGGPIIDSLAAKGDPKAIRFPRSYFERDSLDFSFSGLKTSVLYHVRGHQGRERGNDHLSDQDKSDIAASFQAACIDVLIEKTNRAIRQTGAKSAIIGGGVSANRALRAALSRLLVPAHLPAMQYCTDNAAMSAGLAHLSFVAGNFAPLDIDAITHSQFRDAAKKPPR
jgi:N6-L-threonylcarbamoyladenine synthase